MPGDATKYEQIRYELQDRVALITLNRPEKLNAWTPTMEGELTSAISRAADDPHVGAVIITGAGRAFCAGADISQWSGEMGKGSPQMGNPADPRDGSPEVPIALTRGKPVIAAINGASVGVGFTMPLACDIRIASDRARFSARFVKVGLTPECGATRYLPLVAGIANALYLALTGRIIDATEAKELGLVHKVVPHDQLMEEALALAREIADNPTPAVWVAKKLIHQHALEADLRGVVTLETYLIREMRRQPAHAEAVRAFVEKREPRFNVDT